ncbi:MAG: hypothetical protein K8I29_19525 [Alphaproteobacteria bacterium]|uniref:Uncharacterized protein n=1 Tax=Candidatus Nitrobium versatile TaxID=2884831 RepID=A0A953M3N8_9BACT|nr:hypothetical protein [Candidatus Nitrobium versatile]
MEEKRIITLDELDARDIRRLRQGEGRLSLAGIWTLEHERDGRIIHTQSGKNIIPTAGLNHILDVVLGATAKNANWYVGIFKNNYTPIAGNTAADSLGAAGLYGECQDADYDSPATNRPAFTPAGAAAGVITNSASKASFTIAASITVYGAFLASSQAKTATTGTLIAAKKFDTSRAVVDNDILYVQYEITAISS